MFQAPQMLSAEELLERSYRRAPIPESREKEYAPTESAKESSSTHPAITQYLDLLEHERICRRMNLTVATWDERHNVAAVETLRGNCFKKHGRQTKGGITFNAEETLFLVDQGVLELRYQNLPLCLQEAYMLILPMLPSFEYYQVYAYLCRLGYLVERYQQTETPERVSHHSPSQSSSLESEPEDLSVLRQGPANALWGEGECNPLVKPKDAVTIDDVLAKLQICETVNLAEVAREATCSTSHYKINFDVFTSAEVKKRNPLPAFRVVVCKFDEPPPTLYELATLLQQCAGSHLKMAVVEQSAVCFYGCFSADLTTETLTA